MIIGLTLFLGMVLEDAVNGGHQNPFGAQSLRGEIQLWDDERDFGWVLLSNGQLSAVHLSGDVIGNHLTMGCQIHAQGYFSSLFEAKGAISFNFDAQVIRILSCP